MWVSYFRLVSDVFVLRLACRNFRSVCVGYCRGLVGRCLRRRVTLVGSCEWCRPPLLVIVWWCDRCFRLIGLSVCLGRCWLDMFRWILRLMLLVRTLLVWCVTYAFVYTLVSRWLGAVENYWRNVLSNWRWLMWLRLVSCWLVLARVWLVGVLYGMVTWWNVSLIMLSLVLEELSWLSFMAEHCWRRRCRCR